MQFGLLGRKLAHSLSPQIHACFSDYAYTLFEREPQELDAFFADASIQGFNVTIPYKIDAMRYCDALSDAAKRIGSVNTVIRRADGSLFGDNTDAFGFRYLLDLSGAKPQGKKALILGSGGAAHTVRAVLEEVGCAEVITISRSGENNYQNIFRHFDADLIVNTTPVGMFPENGKAPLDLTPFSRCTHVLDLIYNPLETALLQQAKARGKQTANGLSMLAAQAFCSAELFLHESLDPALIEQAIKQVRRAEQNIVLIGMPGCGKTTVGTLLAQKLGRTFIDTDKWIEETEGMTIPAVFAELGEDFFRDLETNACREIGKLLGTIIATGGGAVLREENRRALRQNAVIIYLQRELGSLATAGRPLSSGKDAVKQLYEARKATYEAFADFTVAVDNNAETTAERVISCIFS